MTIIITWFKEGYMYMIADAAITDEETGEITRLNQLKLIPHPTLNAGISWYGQSRINNKTMTEWIRKLIKNSKDITSINDFADYIKQKVNEANIRVHSGMHISGYEDDGLPVCRHITNNHRDNIVNPDVKKEFIDSGIKPEDIKPGWYVVNGVGQPFKIILLFLKNIVGFEDYIGKVIEKIKINLYQNSHIINFNYDDSPNGFLNKILFYLHITQWFHLYSEHPDFIGGKYSTMIIYRNPPRKEFNPNNNVE